MSYARNLARLARSGIPSVDTLQDLRDLNIFGAIYPDVVYVKGHTSGGDGGGGLFPIHTGAAAGTYVDDDGVNVVPTGGDGSVAWVRDCDPMDVHVDWFGSGLDLIQRVIDYLATVPNEHSETIPRGRIRLGSKRYVQTAIEMPSTMRLTIQGVHVLTSQVVADVCVEGIFIDCNSLYSTLRDFRIDGEDNYNAGKTTVGVRSGPNAHFSKYSELRINYFDVGHHLVSAGQQMIEHVAIQYCNTAAYCYNGAGVHYDTCSFEDSRGVGVVVESTGASQTVEFSSCYFENNGDNGAVEGWQCKILNIRDKNTVAFRSCYFNGLTYAGDAEALQSGIQITWSGTSTMHAVTVENCLFRLMEGKPIESVKPSNYANTAGTILFRGNSLAEDVPRVDPQLYIRTDAYNPYRLIANRDLTQGNTPEAVGYLQQPYLIRKIQIVIAQALAAGETRTLTLGWAGTPAAYFSYAIPADQSVGTVVDITDTATELVNQSIDRVPLLNTSGPSNSKGVVMAFLDVEEFPAEAQTDVS